MLHDVITLAPTSATLTPYAFLPMGNLKPKPRAAILLIPGGGYRFLSERATEPVARQFMAADCNVFILRYGVEEGARDDQPLIQAALAMQYIRTHAEAYHTDPRRVYVCGFSAGGHLACSLGTRWQEEVLAPCLDGADPAIVRPDGMILAYPVITAGRYAHRGSVDRLAGYKTRGDEPELDRWSLEHKVGPHTPPAFIWHTFADRAVPMRNSLMLANALTEAGVPYELHIYPEGPHALSLAVAETAKNPATDIVPHVQGWIELAIKWIKTGCTGK